MIYRAFYVIRADLTADKEAPAVGSLLSSAVPNPFTIHFGRNANMKTKIIDQVR